MKNILILLFLITIALDLHADSITPHLILNFDVNKTLIASDKTENKSIEDVMNEMLSRKYSACWDDTVTEPITFDRYVRTVMMPGEEHDANLKIARLLPLTHFIDFLLERNHPLYSIVAEEFNHLVKQLRDVHIFPAFYRLIAELDRRGISYTLFLRSFGREVFEIKEEMNATLSQRFEVEGMFRQGVLYLNGQEPIETAEEIYAFFSSKKHAAIHDDWHYWMKGEMYAEYGKPFYLDLEDRNTLALFFDDNIKVDSFEKNIIGPLSRSTGESLSISSLLKSNQMIFVDTIEAILNENYFIEKIDQALQEHQKSCK
ncbi:MAG: hypothetical protein ACH350_08105 [Parachlamydiaceae bacterium]